MRRRSEISTRDPPIIRSSSVRGFNGVRRNVETEDVIRAKRVKSKDPEADFQSNIRRNKPALLEVPTGDLASAPKTSEYAFFKKLKKDASWSHSYTSQQEENQLRNLEPSAWNRGISEKFKDIRDNSKSSFLVEKVRPITNSSFLSPLKNESTSSEAANIVGEDSHKDIRSLFSFEKVEPINHSLLFSPQGDASKNTGTEHLDGVFPGKRKRLCQWVASTSLPEGLKNSGYQSCRDAKPMQMRAETEMRTETEISWNAFPELDIGDEDYQWTQRRDLLEAQHGCYLDDVCNRSREIAPSKWDTKVYNPRSTSHASIHVAKPMQMRAETGISWHAFPELDTVDEDYQRTQRRDLLEAENGCYLDDVCNRSRETAPSKWDTRVYKSPSTSHASKHHFQCENNKFSANYEGGAPSLITTQDPYFCSNFENYGYTTSRLIKGPNDFQDMDECFNGRGSSTSLLGWDFNSLKDQGITNRNPEMNSTMAASWGNHQQSQDNSSVACELDTSFFFSYPPQLTSLLHPHSSPFPIGIEKLLFAEQKHFPLSLPCTPIYHNLLDSDPYNTCDSTSTFSPQNHHWVISNVFSETHHPDMEGFVRPSGLCLDLGWRCSSISGSFDDVHSPSYDGSQSPSKESPSSCFLMEQEHEDCFYSSDHSQNIPHSAEYTLDNPEWSSTNFRIPIDKEMATPLLLNSPSWRRTEEDIHYDDGERIYM